MHCSNKRENLGHRTIQLLRAPIKDKNNDVKSDFYESMENAYDSLSKYTVKIIVRDSMMYNLHYKQLRINSVSKAYFSMNKMLSSRLLSKCTKQKLYTCYLRRIIMYAHEIWYIT